MQRAYHLLLAQNSKEALKGQALAMLMLDLKRAEERAETEGWMMLFIDAIRGLIDYNYLALIQRHKKRLIIGMNKWKENFRQKVFRIEVL